VKLYKKIRVKKHKSFKEYVLSNLKKEDNFSIHMATWLPCILVLLFWWFLIAYLFDYRIRFVEAKNDKQ